MNSPAADPPPVARRQTEGLGLLPPLHRLAWGVHAGLVQCAGVGRL